MIVKLLTSLSGPDRNHRFGEVVEMEDAEAVRFIEQELAVPASDQEAENMMAKTPAKETRTDAAVDFAKLKTKADIVEAAKEVHGLELDPSQTKAQLLAAIDAHVETKSE